MILEKGEMFSIWGKTDMFLFTSNSVVNNQGLAVMGRGIAKELADRLPTIRRDFANVLQSPVRVWECDRVNTYDGQDVGYFMVKDHWSEPAKLEIIRQSTEDLLQWVHESERPFRRIDMNFPGIGCGQLDREYVLPIIQKLPDIIHVWEKE